MWAGAAATGCTYAAWSFGLGYLPAIAVARFGYPIPVSALVISHVWLAEPWTPSVLLGAALVLCGVALTQATNLRLLLRADRQRLPVQSSTGCCVRYPRSSYWRPRFGRPMDTHHSTTHHRFEHEELSLLEQHRLTLFKWRYTLESLGFADHEVPTLMFLTWLRATARVHG